MTDGITHEDVERIAKATSREVVREMLPDGMTGKQHLEQHLAISVILKRFDEVGSGFFSKIGQALALVVILGIAVGVMLWMKFGGGH